jgi:S-adenosylmethionine decarboxylase
MSDDGLFQLGMDLDRGSSTAQTEEKQVACSASAGRESKDYFCERDGVRFAGTHLIVDLIGADRLDDLAHIEETLRRCVEAAKATLLHIHLHHFTPNGGVSGVAVLAESHISIHSWPERGFAALDVFMCGDAEPHRAIDVLRFAFQPKRVVVKELLRGKEAERCKTGSKRRSIRASASA